MSKSTYLNARITPEQARVLKHSAQPGESISDVVRRLIDNMTPCQRCGGTGREPDEYARRAKVRRIVERKCKTVD